MSDNTCSTCSHRDHTTGFCPAWGEVVAPDAEACENYDGHPSYETLARQCAEQREVIRELVEVIKNSCQDACEHGWDYEGVAMQAAIARAERALNTTTDGGEG